MHWVCFILVCVSPVCYTSCSYQRVRGLKRHVAFPGGEYGQFQLGSPPALAGQHWQRGHAVPPGVPMLQQHPQPEPDQPGGHGRVLGGGGGPHGEPDTLAHADGTQLPPLTSIAALLTLLTSSLVTPVPWYSGFRFSLGKMHALKWKYGPAVIKGYAVTLTGLHTRG